MEKEIFHVIRSIGREFSEEEWTQYLNESRHNTDKRIVTSIGKYDFNDHDICLNPTTMTIISKKGTPGFSVTLEWCDCGNGLWSYGLDYNTGNGGGGFGCAFADVTDKEGSWRNGYRSEKECIIAACDDAIRHLGNSQAKDDKHLLKLIQMVSDYRDSIGRPEPVQLSLFDF